MDGSQGSFAAFLSTITMAGIGESSILESLPKGSLVVIACALLSLVWAFVRRDAIRYKARFDSVEAAVKSQVTVEQFKAMGEIVRDIDRRQTILETKMGMHG